MRSDLIVLVLFGLAALARCDSSDSGEEPRASLEEHNRLPRQSSTDISDRIMNLFRLFSERSAQSGGEMKKVNQVDTEEDLDDLAEMQQFDSRFLPSFGRFRNPLGGIPQYRNAIRDVGNPASLQDEMKKVNQVDTEEDLDTLAEIQFYGPRFRKLLRELRRCGRARDALNTPSPPQGEMKDVNQVDTEEDLDDLAEMQFFGPIETRLRNLLRQCRNANRDAGNAPSMQGEMKKVNQVDTEEDLDDLAEMQFARRVLRPTPRRFRIQFGGGRQPINANRNARDMQD